ncbi:MAG: hypothetical protein MZW92_41010 [Comamonadaceae bacterium]|nr:hypothetical protein [Comamonadaceae bacterium]
MIGGLRLIGAIDLGWPALAGIAGAVALGYTVFGLGRFRCRHRRAAAARPHAAGAAWRCR